MTGYAWRRIGDGEGHSMARLVQEAGGWLAHGVEVLVADATVACWLQVRLDDRWVTRDARVTAIGPDGDVSVQLLADDVRGWRVDGEERPDLTG